MARRREDRVTVELAVRIWGLNRAGQPFSENTQTGDIAGSGARLTRVKTAVDVGNVIGLQHLTEKSRFRVTWVRDTGDGFFDVGIHSVDPARYVWTPSAEAIARAAENAPEEDTAAGRTERRRHKRYACEGSVQIRAAGGETSWGRIADLSLGGCYIETTTPAPVHADLVLKLKVLQWEVLCEAKVRTAHPQVGMGVVFTLISVEDRKQLNELVAALANERTVAPAVPVPGAAAATTAIDATDAVLQTTDELKRMEMLIKSGDVKVDPRVLSEFRKAMDRARKTAWAVQQWLEIQERKADPYTLLARLEAERLAEATQALREMRVEVESGSLQHDTEGLPELVNEVQRLHTAVSRFTRSGGAAAG